MSALPTPRRPDRFVGPDRPTKIGLLLVVVATLMALPAVVAMPSEYVLEVDEMLPPGWRTNLWAAAFLVGFPAMIIGINRYQKATHRRNRRGRRWANLLTVTAAFGAVIWAAPLLVLAGNGM